MYTHGREGNWQLFLQAPRLNAKNCETAAAQARLEHRVSMTAKYEHEA